jgi:predicted nucleic acid-binding Zn ribbon protein
VRRGKPHAVADLISAAFKNKKVKQKLSAYSAFPHWKEIVGEEIAKVAIPEKIHRKRMLIVQVESAAWAQELTLRKQELLDRIDSFGQGAVIEDIRFITGNPARFNR